MPGALGKSALGQRATVHYKRAINQDFIDLFGQRGFVLVRTSEKVF